jgi:hypothetical protein
MFNKIFGFEKTIHVFGKYSRVQKILILHNKVPALKK